jgi:hypothetical protein
MGIEISKLEIIRENIVTMVTVVAIVTHSVVTIVIVFTLAAMGKP